MDSDRRVIATYRDSDRIRNLRLPSKSRLNYAYPFECLDDLGRQHGLTATRVDASPPNGQQVLEMVLSDRRPNRPIPLRFSQD